MLGIVSILTLGCCSGVLWFVDFPITARKIDKAVADYRAAGLPWEASDIMAPVADHENAAIELNRAWKLMEDDKFAHASSRLKTAANSGDRDKTAQILREVDPLLDILTKATKKPKLDYKRDWDKGFDLELPEYLLTKEGVKQLAHRAVFRAQSKDVDGALADLTTMNRLANLQPHEPALIPLMVGLACNAIYLNTAGKVAYALRNDSAGLKRLEETVTNLSFDHNFRRAIRTDAYLGITFVRNAPAGVIFDPDEFMNSYPDPKELVRTGVPRGAVKQAYLVRYIEAHLFIQKVLNRSDLTPMEKAHEIDQYVVEIGHPVPQMSEFGNYILLGTVSQPVVASERAPTQKQLTLALIRSVEFHLRHGRYPNDLSEIGASSITDPFGHGAMIKEAGGVFFIYTPGLNQLDDGAQQDDWIVQSPPKPW